MRKSLLLFTILALTSAFAAPAKTIEIGFTSAEMVNAPSSLTNTFFEIPNSEVTLMAKGMIKSTKQIGIAKASKSFGIYNKTPLANIQKVEIHLKSGYDKLTTSNAGNFIITTSNTQLTSTGKGTDKAVLANDILTFTPSVTTNSYFRIDLKSTIGGTAYATKMVITYDEGSAEETVPETPTFSVAAGEVAKGTSLTIKSKGATTLTVKTKTADATDWASQTVTGETFTATINENITYNVVGHNAKGDSEAATAAYTIKADTPVPGGNITATVIFKNQEDMGYANGKSIVWIAEEYPSITFNTSATASGSSEYYPKKDGDNLRMYTSYKNEITVNAPKGYKIRSVSGVYTNTSNTGFSINNETTVVKSGASYEFAEDVTSFVIVSKKTSSATGSKNNSTYFSSLTFVLVPDAPIVPEAPSAVTVTPAKAEAKVGESVSVTIAADGTPAPDIHYTVDGTVPTTESAKYAKAFNVTCDALADNEESKVVTVNALAHNSEGEASGNATVTFTRNNAVITVKDAKGNTIGTEGASLALEDGTTEFKATSTGDGTIYWSSEDNKIATVENGVITPLAIGTTTIKAFSDKTGKYNAAEASFTLTVTSPYTYATVRFYKQAKITYNSNTKADWVSEPIDGVTYTFATSVGKLVNAGYPSNNVDQSANKATNLTITKASGVPITVQAPEGYVIVRASYAPTKTYDNPAMAINGEDLAAKTFREFPQGTTSIDLTPGTNLNTPVFSSMTFALTKVVAPTSLTIKPNKTEAVIGQSVSVKIIADEKAIPAPTIYYTRDGSTPVPGAENTETYNPEKGFTLARSIPQTVTINAIAVNSGGQVAAEPVSIVFNDKDHVAPTAITFSQKEGTYAESANFNVKLAADAEAYPTPTLYYTIGGYTAQGDNHIAYDDAQGIDIAKPADGNVVTINAYAVNDAGAVINAATYVFSDNTYTTSGWIRIQDASQLTDGLNVIVAYAPNGSASTELNMMTSGVSSNGGLESVKVECNNTYGVISGDVNKAQKVTLEGNATDGWYLKLYNNEKGYIIPKYKKSIKGYENGLDFTTDKSSAIPTTIDLSDGNAYVTFNGTDREFVYNEQGSRFAGYNKIADTQRRAIDLFREGEYTAGKPYEDLYLVMKSNEIGGAEVAMPFTYEGEGRYTLSVNDLQGSFYIRDGKANNGGTYFGASADECIDPETSTGYVGNSINASVSAIKGEPSIGVKDNNGKDVYAYVGKNGRSEFTLVYDPLQGNHYVFSTHPNTNIGHVARIDHAVFTVEYTPGSQANGRLLVSGMNTTGVDDISTDNLGQARYFNLQGMPVANPASGIYIRIIGDTATKVYIK